MTFETKEVKSRTSIARIIVGALILLIGIGWMLQIAEVVEDIPWSYLLPAAIIVIGIGLVIDARGPTHGGLVALGIILTLMVLVDLSVEPFRFTTGQAFVGPLRERPASVEELEDYSIFAGEVRIDLRDVDLPTGETRLEVSAFAGSIQVIVPSDVTVELEAGTMFGEVRGLGERSEGVGPRVEETSTGSDPSRVLILDVSSFAGEIEVRR